MIAKLLKLFPLQALLSAAAQLLLDNQPRIVARVLELIGQAEASISGGSAKFEWVKARVLPMLKEKAGWAVDSGIQLLVAVFKSKALAGKTII